ncbi:sodium-dependent transporter [Pyrococcus yayanosii]|uniref:Sodium-dependent transporter n=1 Tax=Pyrococcus yayanosii (strain CH1 / JCM 16557) TaxID=529709 RepID=F8AEK0_PYRYC|nr:sodium-dependent transporter [Pyrococcus yayanosii]AEH24679.1 sodium-dependent transporter [Pyrococcus yayanosii CH1]
MEQRDRWATKIGLILAMAGNAIGLGNFVRFPTQVAGNGGGAFMVPYFAALFLLGIPVMWVEWVQGRYGGKYGHGTLGPTFYLMARESLKPKSALIFGLIGGALAFATTTLLNSYYLHLIGWSAAYSWFSITGAYFGKNTAEFFGNYLTNHAQVFLFWGITVVLLGIAVGQGVSKGIERWVKVMMPLLYVFAIILVIYVFALGSPLGDPNWSTIKGFEFIWSPNWSYLREHLYEVLLAASGQIFFTLSLGMGIIQNYASYLGPDDDVALSGLATVSLNEFAEVVLGGSIAVPLAVAYAPKIVPPEVLAQGSTETLNWIAGEFGLGFSYTSLPNIFVEMGTAGRFFGALWFLLLWFAGFTSAIAMYNYLTALLEEDLNIKRSTGTWIVFALYFILGLPVVYIDGYLDQVDAWISFQLALLALFDIIVAVWLFKPDNFWEELHRGAYIRVPGFYKWITMIVAPIFLIFPLAGTFTDLIGKTLGWPARIAILAMLLIGAVETYYAIKKKYGEELEKNEVIIKV